MRTVSYPIQNTSQEPFGFLADEFRILVGSVCPAARLEFSITYSEDIAAFSVS